MSWQATTWAKRQRTGSVGAKAVLMILAENCHADGEAKISVAMIASEAELNERSVKRHIQGLVEKGLLQVRERRRSDGTRDWNAYRIPFDGETVTLAYDQGDNLSSGKADQGDKSCIDKVTKTTDPGDSGVTPENTNNKIIIQNARDTCADARDGRMRAVDDDGVSGPHGDDGSFDDGGGDDQRHADVPAFERLVETWPKGAWGHADKARRYFERLSAAERQQAVEAVGWYLAWLQRAGRTLIPSIATYLEQGNWRFRDKFADAPEPPRGAGPERSEKIFVAVDDPLWTALVAAKDGQVVPFWWQQRQCEGWIFDRSFVDAVRAGTGPPGDEEAAE